MYESSVPTLRRDDRIRILWLTVWPKSLQELHFYSPFPLRSYCGRNVHSILLRADYEHVLNRWSLFYARLSDEGSRPSSYRIHAVDLSIECERSE
ncbi:hypothetical protein CERSUDRAFT_119180 [Gelatoporia subvermispora B]|uniref:Uncharacterized protein n=1 Tax=Ceriporiopsis subvermispora (strain B) TaxID=914234 RepID=M2QZC0_CERS8|nr:hypothetical protein CERSUDRAFT_119180 [Gelatoporia subvermispora B]